MKKKIQGIVLAAVAAAFVVAPAQEAKAISLAQILSGSTQGRTALLGIGAAFQRATATVNATPQPARAVGQTALGAATGILNFILNFGATGGPVGAP